MAKAPLVSGMHPSACWALMVTLPQKPPQPVCRYICCQVVSGRKALNCSWGAMVPLTSHAAQPPGVCVVCVADAIDTATPVAPARSIVASWSHDITGAVVGWPAAGLADAGLLKARPM